MNTPPTFEHIPCCKPPHLLPPFVPNFPSIILHTQTCKDSSSGTCSPRTTPVTPTPYTKKCDLTEVTGSLAVVERDGRVTSYTCNESSLRFDSALDLNGRKPVVARELNGSKAVAADKVGLDLNGPVEEFVGLVRDLMVLLGLCSGHQLCWGHCFPPEQFGWFVFNPGLLAWDGFDLYFCEPLPPASFSHHLLNAMSLGSTSALDCTADLCNVLFVSPPQVHVTVVADVAAMLTTCKALAVENIQLQAELANMQLKSAATAGATATIAPAAATACATAVVIPGGRSCSVTSLGGGSSVGSSAGSSRFGYGRTSAPTGRYASYSHGSAVMGAPKKLPSGFGRTTGGVPASGGSLAAGTACPALGAPILEGPQV